MAVSIETLALARKNGGGGGGSVTVDSALSDSSTNPVQNKVVKSAVDAKVNIDQGIAAAGKSLVVGNDGKVTVANGGGDSSCLLITFTYDSSTWADTADKTFGEIKAAFLSGKTVVANLSGCWTAQFQGKTLITTNVTYTEIDNAYTLMCGGDSSTGVFYGDSENDYPHYYVD